MRYLLVLLLACVISGLGLYAFQNTTVLDVHFGWWSWAAPSWYPVAGAAVCVLVIFVIYLALAGAGWRVRHLLLHRSKVQGDATLEELQRSNERLRDEVAALRADARQTGPRDGDGWAPLSRRRTSLFRR